MPRRLAGGTRLDSPRFSPSGQWIAYFRAEVLHVVSLDGSRNHELGKPGRSGCQWIPGKDQLLVEASRSLQIFTAGNGWRAATAKIEGASLPVVFSPNGSDITYADDVAVGRGPRGEAMRTGRLCRLALGKPDISPRVLMSKYLAAQIPCFWSGDGKYVVSWEDPDFSASAVADGLELFRIPAEGGPPQSLGVSVLVYYGDMLSPSPVKDRLAAAAGEGRNQWENKRIAVIDLETTAVSYLTETSVAAVCPAWSPGGTAIAYSAAPGPGAGARVGGGDEARQLLAQRRIWVADTDSTVPPKQLTSDPHYRDEKPMWSANGKYLLFCRMDRDNQKTLWLMEAGGSDVRQVAGPLFIDPGPLGVDGSWFGYYGHIDWRRMFDWFRDT
jgi:Tol biopolymer transport system component